MSRVTKSMLQPITVIYKFLTSKARVSVWLYENTSTRIEGRIAGFDEFMNIVLEDAEEVEVGKRRGRTPLGRILLKGDNVSALTPAAAAQDATMQA